MVQEEKQLLLIDLSALLPYKVKIMIRNNDIRTVRAVDMVEGIVHFVESDSISPFGVHIEHPMTFRQVVKPYLRPMSSMTDKEKEELKEEHKKDERIYAEVIERIANGDEHARGTAVPHFAADWCNKYHFDYRGLIPMGLELEVPKDMYKTV